MNRYSETVSFVGARYMVPSVIPSAARNLLFLLFFFVLSLPASAQVPTGTPPFGSFGGGPDVINLANLNSHLTIPVIHKPGRGTDFTYDLAYDSSIWYQSNVGGTNTWTPMGSWGWVGQTQVKTGYVTYTKITGDCGDGHLRVPYSIYTFRSYHDQFGTTHTFNIVVDDSVEYCSTPVRSFDGTVALSDGSGLTISVDATPSATVTSATGNAFQPPLNFGAGPGKATDRNGNIISALL